MEGGGSVGLNYRERMKSVIMGEGIKNILGGLGNEFVSLIKEWCIVWRIGVGEIMFNGEVVEGIWFEGLRALVVGGGL